MFAYFDSLFLTLWVPAASKAPPLLAQASPWLLFLLLSLPAQEGHSSLELHQYQLPFPWHPEDSPKQPPWPAESLLMG